MRALLLALFLAGPVWAQNFAPAPVSASAPLSPAAAVSGIHPLLAGSLSDPANPLVLRLQLRAKELAVLHPVLTPGALAAYAAPLMTPHSEPADIVAAGLLLRLSAEPEKAAALGLKSLAPFFQGSKEETHWSRLVETAKRDPAVTALFEGSGAGLALDGLSYKADRVVHNGRKVPVLGRGEFGVVTPHPEIPGTVIKTVSLSGFGTLVPGATPEASADKDEAVARLLEKAGAGPAYLGRASVDRRLLSVRERVYGDTLETMFRERTFTPEDHALVEELLDRMAASRLVVDDLRPSNIMIGTTLRDPRRRAYVVDGGNAVPMDAARSIAEVRREIEDRDIILMTRFDRNVGMIENIRSLGSLLQEGLDRSARRPLWGRIKAFMGWTRTPDPVVDERHARSYRRFLERDDWAKVRAEFGPELARFRALGGGKTAYLRRIGDQIVEKIKKSRGTSELGFHFNLHGGAAEGYVNGGGIRAAQGDIALQYTMNGDRAHKVYFFDSKNVGLYDVLNERHPNLISSRMGSVLNIFALDSVFLQKAFEEGGASHRTAISIDFDLAWLAKNSRGQAAIPYDTYVAPPLDVFNGVARKLGVKLTRDEETLAVMRYIERAAGG